MKTYPTYQEAKIANPESDIYSAGLSEFTAEKPMHNWATSGLLCNPADYCMTVEQFLKDGHKFVDGDLIYSQAIDAVVTVSDNDKIASSYRVKSSNELCASDCNRYILRAAALEKPKQISDTAREAFSTDSTPKIHKDSEFHKKPGAKVEFVKVEDSIWCLETAFKCGELFAFDCFCFA